MPTMADPQVVVTGGVDTHSDVHVAAALDQLGRQLGTATFPTTEAGYRALAAWLAGFGTVAAVGVEGTGSWGAGLTRLLTRQGVTVIEVNRPNRQQRRRHGKSDTADAIAAAKAVQSGDAARGPRGGTGPIESLRVLRIARDSAVAQQRTVINQIRSIISTSPDPIRRQLNGNTITRIVAVAAAYRPGDPIDPQQGTKLALRSLAGQHRALTSEIRRLSDAIASVVNQVAPPELLAMTGVGPITAADLLITAGTNPSRFTKRGSFAAMCGVSPVDASSGKHQRHRLNRGGDRQANAALHRIAITRLRYHPPTIVYLQRRINDGKTKKEALRCIKYALARHIQTILTTPT